MRGKLRGFIAYEGASRFDGKPIVGVVTLRSHNEKTGDMAQLWILRSDIAPQDAVNTGQDISVCGGCTHRHYTGGACYVVPFHAPHTVYSAYKRGVYNKLSFMDGLSYLGFRGLRLGAYGDPAMLPVDVLKRLREAALFTTGYTHQWKHRRLSDALQVCQASVDSEREYEELKSMHPDAKAFRVVADTTHLMTDEVICRADTHYATCATCRLCDGKTQDVAIEVHGAKAKRFTAR